MYQRLVGCLVLFTILLFGMSCTKLGEPGPGEQKLMPTELTKTDSIPADWGKLISVSSTPGIDRWAQLWFQDDEGVIRIVAYNVRDNYLSRQARTIQRD